MMSLENDKLTKRTKEEKMRGLKRSIVEEVFGGYFLNTGKGNQLTSSSYLN